MDEVKSIEIALENELRERDFYLEHSRRTQNPLGKEMFASIAEDENEHYTRLKDLHEQMLRLGTWPETIPATVADTSIRDIIKNIPKLADTSARSDTDDIQAVKTAIDLETKGYEFYSRLADNAGTPAAAEFFRHLARIEREHCTSLKESLLFFENPQAWFEQNEKPHFEG